MLLVPQHIELKQLKRKKKIDIVLEYKRGHICDYKYRSIMPIKDNSSIFIIILSTNSCISSVKFTLM